jgi:hypothetical protein
VSGAPAPSPYMDVSRNRNQPIGQDPTKPKLSLRRGTVRGNVRHGKFRPRHGDCSTESDKIVAELKRTAL